MQSEKEIIEEIELAKLAWRDRQHFDCANWLYKARPMPKEHFKKKVEKELAGTGNGTPGDYLSCTRARCRSLSGRLRRRL